MRSRSPIIRSALAVLLLLTFALGSVNDGAAATGVGAEVAIPASAPAFAQGINFGWTEGWTDAGLSTIAARAGAGTARIKLPEYYLAEWGYDIAFQNGAMPAYAANGLTDLTSMLIGPSRAHSNAPGGGDLDRYSPKNLYEPIWSSPGVVNPNNYWAAYVQATVTKYKGQVRIWEVWNEPDYTENWEATQGAWWTSPPSPGDLPNWNDSIFSYIRLLRITYEVAKAVDPNCFIAIGGIGYESFLDATLRYSDNPAGGAIAAQYPARGGAWFDAVSFHQYPEYAVFDRATQTWLRGTDSDAMIDKFMTQRSNLRRLLDDRGFNGGTYPRKLWLSTETGVSSKAAGGAAGGLELQRNYLLKLPILAQAGGLAQVHWYQLADTEADSAASSTYAHMGLYYDLRSRTVANAQRKPSANAYATGGAILRGLRHDSAGSAALALPGNVRGQVFSAADGRRTYALWATTSANNEAATASLRLPTAVPLEERQWDFATTGAKRTLAPSGGVVALSLTGTPVFLTETMASAPPPAPPPTNPTGSPSPIPSTAPRGPQPTFSDVPPTHPYYQAITELAARGIIRGYGDGRFWPDDTIIRAQMAALICRASGWDGEDHGNNFPDRGPIDDNLWRNVGTLAHYGVARGYPDGTYGPTDMVLHIQTISFITRAMVKQGRWQQVTVDNPALYPNVSVASGHRFDLLTYVNYAGAVPGTDPTAAWADWQGPSTRGWFAQAQWQAMRP